MLKGSGRYGIEIIFCVHAAYLGVAAIYAGELAFAAGTNKTGDWRLLERNGYMSESSPIDVDTYCGHLLLLPPRDRLAVVIVAFGAQCVRTTGLRYKVAVLCYDVMLQTCFHLTASRSRNCPFSVVHHFRLWSA